MAATQVGTTPATPRRRSVAVLGNALLLLAGLVLAGLLGEGFARWFFPHWAPETGAITRFWQYDPTLGWSHLPNTTGSFNAFGFESLVTINAKGFRDRERSYERTPGKYRIVVLGDSMVWGFGAQQEGVFTRVMEKQREDLEVVNLGVSGYGTDQELLLWRQEGIQYRPDLCVVVVWENDFLTNVQSTAFLAYQKPLFELLADGNVRLTNTPVPQQPAWKRLAPILVRSSYLLNRMAQAYERLRVHRATPWPPAKEDPSWQQPFPRNPREKLTAALLLTLQQEVQQAGAAFVMVVVDGMGLVGKDLEAFFGPRHIQVINLDAVLPQEQATALHIPDGVHWNAAGHKKVAERLLAYVDEKRLTTGGRAHEH